MKRTFKFKPKDNVRLYYLTIEFLILLIPNIGAFIYDITHTTIFSISIFGMVVLALDFLFLFFYFISYIACPEKYIIDDTYFTKKYRGEELFKIKKSDIEKIYVVKAKKCRIFGDIAATFIAADVSFDPSSILTRVSFIFSKCEFVQYEKKQNNPKLSLRSPLDFDKIERYDTLSFRKCKQICKALNIEPICLNVK